MMSIDGFFILSRYIKTRSAHMYIYTHFFVACIYHIFAMKQLLWIPQGPTNHFRAAAHLRHAATCGAGLWRGVWHVQRYVGNPGAGRYLDHSRLIHFNTLMLWWIKWIDIYQHDQPSKMEG